MFANARIIIPCTVLYYSSPIALCVWCYALQYLLILYNGHIHSYVIGHSLCDGMVSACISQSRNVTNVCKPLSYFKCETVGNLSVDNM